MHVASPEQMQEVLAELQEITTALEEALAEADQASARLHTVWSGAAAAAHHGSHERWSRDAVQMNDMMVALRVLLATARANYASASETNRRMWS